MRRLAFFISGTGGNALNLLTACREGRIPGKPVLGIASSAKAGGVERLRAQDLEVAVLERSAFADDAAYSEACFQRAEQAGAEVIALCGWLKKLVVPPRWEGRILNIHPGPLPRFGGAGMFGMKVHQAVIAAGASESAVTIHLVDNEYDHGRHLAVQTVPVLPGDTPETLQKRVYEQEMRLYPEALAAFLRTL
ncbi:phosphoribosylglycinamide formyltransferase [Holophaga foetida]|uniref:phosphoribosylglycinamide formyltransferase n=1 Tax=Holophaga foetida TaxID=35839 RepID=UPI0002472A9B|nr:phosphoribosylglycinamide formyltransferase [Holophaga foetida]